MKNVIIKKNNMKINIVNFTEHVYSFSEGGYYHLINIEVNKTYNGLLNDLKIFRR